MVYAQDSNMWAHVFGICFVWFVWLYMLIAYKYCIGVYNMWKLKVSTILSMNSFWRAIFDGHMSNSGPGLYYMFIIVSVSRSVYLYLFVNWMCVCTYIYGYVCVHVYLYIYGWGCMCVCVCLLYMFKTIMGKWRL